jgi:uncharacterized membrane protein
MAKEKSLHLAFRITLLLKAALALTEVVAGAGAFFVSSSALVAWAGAITRGELAEDPSDLLANYLLHSAQHLSIGTQRFMALYLASHGVIKLVLVAGLLRESLWTFPAAIVIFGMFVIYQLHRFGASHSAWLLVFTAVDIAVIALTWHEYRFLRRARTAGERH